MHYILCKNDMWTSILKNEMTSSLTKNCKIIDGYPIVIINDDISLKNEYLAFSTTALINASLVNDQTVSKQVNDIIEILETKSIESNTINLHVYSMTQKYGIIETGRADIIKNKLLQYFRKKGLSALKKGFDRKKPFLQVLILPDRSIAFSLIKGEEMNSYHSLISPFVGGFQNVSDDKKAPSRAFKKIVEAQQIIGKEISKDELVVDLGACPGGWTYIARNQGAHVTALDRSPLDSHLMMDEKVTFLQEDAFKYKVNKAVDWAVSDIICKPERILELIEYWVKEKQCKNFIFTIKFQGQKDYDILKKFKTVAKKSEYRVIIKQLNSNKNEVTIMGSL